MTDFELQTLTQAKWKGPSIEKERVMGEGKGGTLFKKGRTSWNT